MPELPEVEVICQGITSGLVGRRLTGIVSSGHSLRVPVPESALHLWGVGARVLGVTRRAKYILLRLDNQAQVVLHLGMTGKLGFFSTGAPLAKHDHLRFVLDNQQELRFNDTRRFGSVQLIGPGSMKDFFKGLGPEPFGGEFSAEYLLKTAGTRTMPVKNYLMNNKVVVGIGNIYASEILFEAQIIPTKPVSELILADWQDIVQKTVEVLKRAIAAGGSTIADFVNSNGQKGYFQHEFMVYGKKDQLCKICDSKINKTVMAGRATYWCGVCQK